MIIKEKFNLENITDVEIDGIDTRDYPDFSDAYISHALYKGREMTEDELYELQDQYPDWFYNKIEDNIY